MAAEPGFVPSATLDQRLPRRDAYYWRLLATALQFCAFGLGALVVGVLLLPVVKVVPASRERRRARARRVVGHGLHLFARVSRGLGLVTYDFQGVDRLGRPGQLIVANHPTLIDVVFLLGFARDAGCVVKHGLWRNPLTRWAVTLAEYITNDPTATMIDGAAQSLREGQALVMFPEGTRTTPGKPVLFHRGAANVALRAAAILTPVYIRCEPVTLTKNEPWYRIPARRPHFTLRVGNDVNLQPYRGQPLPLASRALNEALQAEFQAALSGRS
jgi:1-acyl-sn-glycerol-3-phosphate acyltransferase